MDYELTKLIVMALVAIGGWIFVDWLNSRRGAVKKRCDLIVHQSIDSYNILNQEIARRDTSIESITKLENLLSEIHQEIWWSWLVSYQSKPLKKVF